MGDTITYQIKISNVSFQKGAAILGVAATVHPDVDGIYAENGQVKFVHSLGKNPELLNQGESVTASHTHTLTAAGIEKSSVDKKINIPLTEEYAQNPLCNAITEHTQNLKSPFLTYAPWVAGALAIISAAAGVLWFFFKDQLPQLFR